MTDDRDRRAAEEWLRNWFVPGSDLTQHIVLAGTLTALLSAFRAAARAEGAAEAIEACLQRIERRERERDRSTYRADSPLEIAALLREEFAPAGIVAVDKPDLVTVLDAAADRARDLDAMDARALATEALALAGPLPEGAVVVVKAPPYATLARALLAALDEREALAADLPHALGACDCSTRDCSDCGYPVRHWGTAHTAAIARLEGRGK